VHNPLELEPDPEPLTGEHEAIDPETDTGTGTAPKTD
jgi:hypothetical protein